MLQEETNYKTLTFYTTNTQNPVSLRPSTSFIASLVSFEGALIAESESNLQVINKIGGSLVPFLDIDLRPLDFDLGKSTAYILKLFPINYEDQLQLILTLPIELEVEEGSTCEALEVVSEDIECQYNSQDRTWLITETGNISQVLSTSTQAIEVKLYGFKNPSEEIETGNIEFYTQTAPDSTGKSYLIDKVYENFQIDFACADPCATCKSGSNHLCETCPENFPFLMDSFCYHSCPEGTFVGTQGLSCFSCSKGCKSCTGKLRDQCTSCQNGYVLTEQNECYPDIESYPFPFLLAGILWLTICTISMLILKKKSEEDESVEMHFIPSAIIGLSIIIHTQIVFLLAFTYKFGFKITFLLAICSIGLIYLHNLFGVILFKQKISKQECFKDYTQDKKCYKVFVIISGLFLNQSLLKAFYSKTFGLKISSLDIQDHEIRPSFKLLSYSSLLWLVVSLIAFIAGFKESLDENAQILLKCSVEAFILITLTIFLIIVEYEELCEFLSTRVACLLCCVFSHKPGKRIVILSHKKSISDSNQALMANSVSIQTLNQGAGPFNSIRKRSSGIDGEKIVLEEDPGHSFFQEESNVHGDMSILIPDQGLSVRNLDGKQKHSIAQESLEGVKTIDRETMKRMDPASLRKETQRLEEMVKTIEKEKAALKMQEDKLRKQREELEKEKRELARLKEDAEETMSVRESKPKPLVSRKSKVKATVSMIDNTSLSPVKRGSSKGKKKKKFRNLNQRKKFNKPLDSVTESYFEATENEEDFGSGKKSKKSRKSRKSKKSKVPHIEFKVNPQTQKVRQSKNLNLEETKSQRSGKSQQLNPHRCHGSSAQTLLSINRLRQTPNNSRSPPKLVIQPRTNSNGTQSIKKTPTVSAPHGPIQILDQRKRGSKTSPKRNLKIKSGRDQGIDDDEEEEDESEINVFKQYEMMAQEQSHGLNHQESRTERKEAQIFYSDKSESSVEQAMGETPSSYNLENMRFEGKSTGLQQNSKNVNPLPLHPDSSLSQMPEYAIMGNKEVKTNKHKNLSDLSERDRHKRASSNYQMNENSRITAPEEGLDRHQRSDFNVFETPSASLSNGQRREGAIRLKNWQKEQQKMKNFLEQPIQIADGNESEENELATDAGPSVFTRQPEGLEETGHGLNGRFQQPRKMERRIQRQQQRNEVRSKSQLSGMGKRFYPPQYSSHAGDSERSYSVNEMLPGLNRQTHNRVGGGFAGVPLPKLRAKSTLQGTGRKKRNSAFQTHQNNQEIVVNPQRLKALEAAYLTKLVPNTGNGKKSAPRSIRARHKRVESDDKTNQVTITSAFEEN